MTTIRQVSQAMQQLLTEVADEAGMSSGFIQRRRKLSGASFVQALVFGWMSNPQASLEELSQSAATCGVAVSGQGLDQRFNERASQHFRGVYLLDSTVVGLPASLQAIWSGCGNQNGSSAGLKIQTILEYQQGRLTFSLHPARQNDRCCPNDELPPGGLRLADSGFFDLKHFQRLTARRGLAVAHPGSRPAVG
jgi:hypothetical protein